MKRRQAVNVVLASSSEVYDPGQPGYHLLEKTIIVQKIIQVHLPGSWKIPMRSRKKTTKVLIIIISSTTAICVHCSD